MNPSHDIADNVPIRSQRSLAAEAGSVLSLCGEWRLRQAGRNGVIPAHVPGCVHTDLLAASKIPNPFDRDNEDHLQWIGESGWIYSREFVVPVELLQHERVLLRCDGLDTLAAVSLDGRVVGRADNMYRRWEFDVRRYLKPGRNRVVVRFASAMRYIRARQARCELPGWNGPREPKGRAWLRKQPSNFGWDWGPVLVTCGIWRAIKLVAFDTARLGDVHVQQHHAKTGAVTLSVNIVAEVIEKKTALTVAVRVTLDGSEVATAALPLTRGRATATLKIDRPQLWWPNGMGRQPLYHVVVELHSAGGRILDTQTRRIGLRTLRLDRHKDQWGESFQFVVNRVPFFAKGANWIPADAFVTRLTPARYRPLLQSAATAYMNMLRVWGGGMYEDDAFYDLCDELGICIWQDFMFACSTCPTFDRAFMANVKAECADNIRRLRPVRRPTACATPGTVGVVGVEVVRGAFQRQFFPSASETGNRSAGYAGETAHAAIPAFQSGRLQPSGHV